MSVENWSGSMEDKLIESAITAGSFMIIYKLYYNSPLGMEWKKGGLSFVASYLSEFGSDILNKTAIICSEAVSTFHLLKHSKESQVNSMPACKALFVDVDGVGAVGGAPCTDV